MLRPSASKVKRDFPLLLDVAWDGASRRYPDPADEHRAFFTRSVDGGSRDEGEEVARSRIT